MLTRAAGRRAEVRATRRASGLSNSASALAEEHNGMRGFLEKRLRRAGEAVEIPFAIRFAGGPEYRNRDGTPQFVLSFRTERAEWRTASFGHIGLIDSYVEGEIDIEGSVRSALAVGLAARLDRPNPFVGIANRWHEFRLSNATWAQAKANARFHYALGTDFYRYWLDDPYMMYTCGYWKEGTATLEAAQQNKIDHVCRKVRLSPGEEVVDIGCGFGGFMFRAHERHNVRVTGINTTTEQVEMVRGEIDRRRLGETLDVIDTDFRDVRREYDKVVSIGVLEHAGRDQIPDVVAAHARFLKKGGLGMLHFIGHVGHDRTEYFIRKHVFPGGWIPRLADVIVAMERAGLEVIDIENLRRHYALTLDAWAERFERHWDAIHALDPKRFNERFRRVWRVYLYGCAEMFRSPIGVTHLFQIVFAKGNVARASYPMSRAFLYEADFGGAAAQEPPRVRRVGGAPE
ncbi:MAG TPA: cyclopropane-fatty-acyl-phospholipid synthase family protein [Burkholderiales bacterium]|nr:cyclopropane-fatty-acyl-phospholipid synthase family protein [Burkholderiales bacterium]